MVLFIYEERGVKYMSNITVFILSEDVIDECLADSIEKTSK